MPLLSTALHAFACEILWTLSLSWHYLGKSWKEPLTFVPTPLALQRGYFGAVHLKFWSSFPSLICTAFGGRLVHWEATMSSLKESRMAVLSKCSSPGPLWLLWSCCWSAARWFAGKSRRCDVFCLSITFTELPLLLACAVAERTDSRMKVIWLQVCSGETNNSYRKEEMSVEVEVKGSKGGWILSS